MSSTGACGVLVPHHDDAWKLTLYHGAAEVQGQPLIARLDRAFSLHVVHVRHALRAGQTRLIGCSQILRYRISL